jgi:hypothetical protein
MIFKLVTNNNFLTVGILEYGAQSTYIRYGICMEVPHACVDE